MARSPEVSVLINTAYIKYMYPHGVRLDTGFTKGASAKGQLSFFYTNYAPDTKISRKLLYVPFFVQNHTQTYLTQETNLSPTYTHSTSEQIVRFLLFLYFFLTPNNETCSAFLFVNCLMSSNLNLLITFCLVGPLPLLISSSA